MTALVNGKPACDLPLADRGLHYGDGLFETMRVHQGRIHFLDRHIGRLLDGCQRLGIPIPEHRLLQDEIDAVTADTSEGLVKLIVTRGQGGRGYAPPTDPLPTRILLTYPLPEELRRVGEPGIRVRRCVTRLAINPDLAGIKHLNRLEQVLARSEWRDPEVAEGLMYDTEGYLVEATRSNVFIVKTGRILTPDLSGSGVAGVMRERVMALAADCGLAVHVRRLTDAHISNADEIFLTSSVRGIQPVTAVDDVKLPPGRITPGLQDALMKETGW